MGERQGKPRPHGPPTLGPVCTGGGAQRDTCTPLSAEKETEASPTPHAPSLGETLTHACSSCEAHREADQPQWSRVASCPAHPLGILAHPRPRVFFLSPPPSADSQVQLDFVSGGVASAYEAY